MKRKWFIALLFVASFTSCSNNDKRERKEEQTMKGIERSSKSNKPDLLPWNAEYNQKTNKLELKQTIQDLHNVKATDIINLLNRKYPQIGLKMISLVKDTLTVEIADASYLTQQMGSAGAETYLAEATYSLTELPGIRAVKFNFQEGDHAAPGTYTRENFKYYN